MKLLSNNRNGIPGNGTMKKAKDVKIQGISCLLSAVSNRRPINLDNSKSNHSTSTATTHGLKSVSFAQSVRVRTTISRSSYTKEERQACFYSDEESQQIQKKSLKIVEKMEEGCPLFMSKYCTRGLEKHTRIAGRLRLQNRFDALLAVLNEQDQQRIDGICDDESISRVYSMVTCSCQLWANCVGLCDQRQAERDID